MSRALSPFLPPFKERRGGRDGVVFLGCCSSHVVLELLQVLVLLGQLLLDFHQLLLLAQADGVVLVGLLALGEGVSVWMAVRLAR